MEEKRIVVRYFHDEEMASACVRAGENENELHPLFPEGTFSINQMIPKEEYYHLCNQIKEWCEGENKLSFDCVKFILKRTAKKGNDLITLIVVTAMLLAKTNDEVVLEAIARLMSTPDHINTLSTHVEYVEKVIGPNQWCEDVDESIKNDFLTCVAIFETILQLEIKSLKKTAPSRYAKIMMKMSMLDFFGLSL